MRLTPQALFGGLASLVVLAAVVAGLWLVGAPSDARLRRLDDQRVGALQVLASTIDNYRQTHGGTPRSLGQLAQDQDRIAPSSMRDPDTSAPYEYRRTGPNTYELCARFSVASDDEVALRWRHGSGRQCYSLTAVVPPH